MTTIAAIETTYAGHRFRSRLEARWAVFFDHMRVPWLYEPEGFAFDDYRYLPDFYLPECGTWIEVKGDATGVDWILMETAARRLPLLIEPTGEPGPRLMLLGTIPPPMHEGDYGWAAHSGSTGDWDRYGFGTYQKNNRPWWHGTTYPSTRASVGPWFRDCGWEDQLCWSLANLFLPTVDPSEWDDAQPAYAAARRARFEHGESGA